MARSNNNKDTKKVKIRDMRNSNWGAFGRWITAKDRHTVINKTSCGGKFRVFLIELKVAIDTYLPEKKEKFITTIDLE